MTAAPANATVAATFAIEPPGALLHVANRDSDSIISFGIDPASGRLTPTGHAVAIGSPSSIVFRVAR